MVSRRAFFSELGRSVVSNLARAGEAAWGAVPVQLETPPAPQTRGAWLRPPGALAEADFRATCTQCTACQEACPFDSIRRLGPEFGPDAGTPCIIADESPCYLCEDMPCIASCEPKALLPVAPRQVRMGTAVLDAAKCYVVQGQPCDYCVVRCPLKSDAIGWSDSGAPAVNVDGCVGCGVCAYLCPADALTIEPNVTSSKGKL